MWSRAILDQARTRGMKEKRSPFAVLMARINAACGVLSGIALLLMMVAGSLDILTTNLNWVGLQSRPIAGAFEFIGAMMVVSVFLSVSLAQERREHIQVEMLVHMLSPRGRKAAEVWHYLLGAVFFALIAWASWPAALHSFRVGEFAAGLINFPIWPARMFLAFGATLVAAQCVLDILGVLSSRFRTGKAAHDEIPTV